MHFLHPPSDACIGLNVVVLPPYCDLASTFLNLKFDLIYIFIEFTMLEQNILHYIFMFQNTFWQDLALHIILHKNLIVVSRASLIHTDSILTIFSMMKKPVFIWLLTLPEAQGMLLVWSPERFVSCVLNADIFVPMQWFSSRNQSLSAPQIIFSPACRYRLNVVYDVLSLRLFWYIFMFCTQIIFKINILNCCYYFCLYYFFNLCAVFCVVFLMASMSSIHFYTIVAQRCIISCAQDYPWQIWSKKALQNKSTLSIWSFVYNFKEKNYFLLKPKKIIY